MLIWPQESVGNDRTINTWSHSGSNNCLDFHGNPATAELCVLSDGNHHMALLDTLEKFIEHRPSTSVFYATTPPGPILELLQTGTLKIGNLVLSVEPDVFICPPDVLDKVVQQGMMDEHAGFMKNQGNVLLVRKDNPKLIAGIQDLARDDVTIFLSNPVTEKLSYTAYRDTIHGLCKEQNIGCSFLEGTERIYYGERIHHREAPQSLADGKADVALVFYHLALRYIRIFPDLFSLIPLGGTVEKPVPSENNVRGFTHFGLLKNSRKLGEEFVNFLATPAVTEIYHYHGLLRDE